MVDFYFSYTKDGELKILSRKKITFSKGITRVKSCYDIFEDTVCTYVRSLNVPQVIYLVERTFKKFLLGQDFLVNLQALYNRLVYRVDFYIIEKIRNVYKSFILGFTSTVMEG